MWVSSFKRQKSQMNSLWSYKQQTAKNQQKIRRKYGENQKQKRRTHPGSNQRPADLQSAALPLSYTSDAKVRKYSTHEAAKAKREQEMTRLPLPILDPYRIFPLVTFCSRWREWLKKTGLRRKFVISLSFPSFLSIAIIKAAFSDGADARDHCGY